MRVQGLSCSPLPAKAALFPLQNIFRRRYLNFRTSCSAIPAVQGAHSSIPSSPPSVMGHITPFPASSAGSGSSLVHNLSPLQRRLKDAGVPDWARYDKPHHAALSTEAELVEFVSKVAELCWEGVLPEDVDALLQWPSLGPWHGSFKKTFLPNLDYLRSLFQDLAIMREPEEPAGLSPLGRLLRNHPADMSRILNRAPAALLALDAWACGELGLSRRQLGEAALKSPRILRLCPERGRQVAAFLQAELRLSPQETGTLLATDPSTFAQSPETLFGSGAATPCSNAMAGNTAAHLGPATPSPGDQAQGPRDGRGAPPAQRCAGDGPGGEWAWNVAAATALSSPSYAPGERYPGVRGTCVSPVAVAAGSAPSTAQPASERRHPGESARDSFRSSPASQPPTAARHPSHHTLPPAAAGPAGGSGTVPSGPASTQAPRAFSHSKQQEGASGDGQPQAQPSRFRTGRGGKPWRHSKRGKRGAVPSRVSKIKVAKERQLRSSTSQVGKLVPRCTGQVDQ